MLLANMMHLPRRHLQRCVIDAGQLIISLSDHRTHCGERYITRGCDRHQDYKKYVILADGMQHDKEMRESE